MLESSNDIIGFGCVSSSNGVGGNEIISSGLLLEHNHIRSVNIGMNAMNRKITINPMKPDSTFSACCK